MVDHTQKHRKKILQAAVKTRRAALPFIAAPPLQPPFAGATRQANPVLVHLIGYDGAQEGHE